ncbi:MAG: ATP-binding protein [Isosphaeraceae bacterium]|nr:ATP-binding protein [Isosphaeraceae bacterium]
MSQIESYSSRLVDLTTCELEPIHIPGGVQPFGCVLVIETTGLTVLQASANVGQMLGREPSTLLGHDVADVIGTANAAQLRELPEIHAGNDEATYLGPVAVGAETGSPMFHALAHRWDGAIILELEPFQSGESVAFPNLYPLLRSFLANLALAQSVSELAHLAAVEARRITGYDRVLIYRFDEDENGTVIAEDRNDVLPSYLDLRFPASDIPRQARKLYRLNRLRLIPDASYRPVPIVPPLRPDTGRPLDMTYTRLRSVSPIHVQYMRNMGTAASMSISLLQNGALWGLISCHHQAPRVVSLGLRTVCGFLGEVLSLQLEAKERQADSELRMRLGSIQAKLLGYMAEEDQLDEALENHPEELLSLADAQSAAVIQDETLTRIGAAPDEAFLRKVVDWLDEHVRQDVFETDSLASVFPEASNRLDRAAGLLAVAISKVHKSYVLWFRPEIIRTVRWGGDPRKPVAPEHGEQRLRPRTSFETWKETVRGRSAPWRRAEVEAANELRNAVVGVVLRNAEEKARLGTELMRINEELEAFSYSVSHDLRAPFRHISGYSELLMEEKSLSETGRRYAATIIESARYAGDLVDNLLAFSQMGRASIHPAIVDMNQLAEAVRRDVAGEAQGRNVVWKTDNLPDCVCDPALLRLALRNLFSNAVKYTRTRAEAVIEVGAKRNDGEVVYFVRDNGIGFDMQYVHKLFGVFQRLHRMDDFEGTGIGLANVRRIVERHGGRVWAEGRVDEGATFYFALPASAETEEA